eukprot:CAMPEP_0119062500 /NCGR_PEP_ID=MMETSP1178-20130426/6072_1 /TAXON_ID=33656 /ORGANISM="unid sp, Strain CCMP2000" /LENGTH=274 /DNA_ID=CAMNT_0007043787 /DNA_START=70 /DNA_END=894 /DNA_ORIENTATION=-
MGGLGSKYFLSHFSKEEVEIYESCTCLDGAELANIYGKFISMGGRRVTKGMEEERFRHIVGQKTVRNMQAGADVASAQVHKATRAQKVTKKLVCELPEFDNNPFAPRLCEVFSADGSGDLSFDELLDMFHALSPKAEREVKILTAFRMYDFDGDGYLNNEDISTLIKTTTVRPGKRTTSSRGSASTASPASIRSSTPRAPDRAVDELEAGEPGAAPGKKKPGLEPDVLADVVDHVMHECDLDGRGRLSFHEFKRVMERFPDIEAKLSVSIFSGR